MQEAWTENKVTLYSENTLIENIYYKKKNYTQTNKKITIY